MRALLVDWSRMESESVSWRDKPTVALHIISAHGGTPEALPMGDSPTLAHSWSRELLQKYSHHLVSIRSKRRDIGQSRASKSCVEPSEHTRLSLSSSESGLDNTPPFREDAGVSGERRGQKTKPLMQVPSKGEEFWAFAFLLSLGGCHHGRTSGLYSVSDCSNPRASRCESATFCSDFRFWNGGTWHVLTG
jgi:hypothetical protein